MEVSCAEETGTEEVKSPFVDEAELFTVDRLPCEEDPSFEEALIDECDVDEVRSEGEPPCEDEDSP